MIYFDPTDDERRQMSEIAEDIAKLFAGRGVSYTVGVNALLRVACVVAKQGNVNVEDLVWIVRFWREAVDKT